MIKHFIQLNKEPGYIRPASSQPNLSSILIKNKISHRDFKNMLLEEIVYLVNRLCEADDIKSISQLMLQQIGCETKRFGFLVNLTQYLVQVYKGSQTFESENNARLDQLLEGLNGNKSFEGENSEQLSSIFEGIRKSHPVSGFNLTEEERLQIIQSAGLDVTRWYKCRNGHIYGIGDCGQASQASRCPTCNESIGGVNHRLADNNQLALEMTAGVPPPAPVDPFMVLYH
uniref:RZ-type domain-containing protein n=1 Tax=Ditylenchus dipsaci TaxID=166011 RepID=A0A915EPG5_9BILA